MNGKRTVRIITDTTASLPEGFAAAHGVPVIPQVIVLGERAFLENVEITQADFIRYLKASDVLPKTQAPPPGECVRAYQQALSEADVLICLHPSSDVSGTVRSANTAKESTFPEADIRIIDTRTIGANLGSLVRAAVGWAEQGLGPDEIERRVREMATRGVTYFLVSTLEYLRRGGRIGAAAALAGGVLQVKPILQFVDGHVAPLEKVRTHHRALARLAELVLEACPPMPASYLTVMQADAEAEGRALAEQLRGALGLDAVPMVDVGAAITTHAGPGTLGVGFFTAPAL
jgi:DegV family protein with EDD domain